MAKGLETSVAWGTGVANWRYVNTHPVKIGERRNRGVLVACTIYHALKTLTAETRVPLHLPPPSLAGSEGGGRTEVARGLTRSVIRAGAIAIRKSNKGDLKLAIRSNRLLPTLSQNCVFKHLKKRSIV